MTDDVTEQKSEQDVQNAEDENSPELEAETPEKTNREKFDEALVDTFNVTLPYEAFKARAYRGRREKFYTIGCGNLYHPKDSKYKGRKVRRGDKIPNNSATKMQYFKSAYNPLFTPISQNLDMEKMNHDQVVATCDMLYNRGPACLTNNNGCLSDSLNCYLENPCVRTGILPSLYMTAKRDDEPDMRGLKKRRNHERRLMFGEDAQAVIEATDAIKTVPWKKLSNSDLQSLINVVAECGPDCLTAEDAELPKVIRAYVNNPTEQNKQNFDDTIKRSYDTKFIQRPSENQKIEIPDIKEMIPLDLMSTWGTNALNSDAKVHQKLQEKDGSNTKTDNKAKTENTPVEKVPGTKDAGSDKKSSVMTPIALRYMKNNGNSI